jgi:hypothetical protein
LNLANAQIFLFVSQLLATFEVRPPLKTDGNEEEVVIEYSSSFVRSATILCTYHYVLLISTWQPSIAIQVSPHTA